MTLSASRSIDVTQGPQNIEVSRVPPEAAAAVWSTQTKAISKAIRSGQGDSTTSEAMLADILRGRVTLWAAHRGEEILAVVVLSVTNHFTGKKVFVHLLAGQDMDEWAGDVQRLLLDCKELVGAMCIEASCRFGLGKRLRKLGWRKKAEIMELR